MRKWQQLTLSSILAGVVAFCFTSSYASTPEAYQNAFIEFFEIGPATELKINAHGKNSSDIDKSLSDIYHLSLIHISEPTRRRDSSRMPSSA